MTITFSPAQDGGGYLYEIDTGIIPSLPEWAPEKNGPPLSVQSALAIARNEITKMNLEQKMKLGTVRISSASSGEKYTIWYYSVTFENDARHIRDGFVEKTINILMNGDVLKARKISQQEYSKWFR